MGTQDIKASIEAAMADFKAAKAEAAKKTEAAEAKANAIIEAAGQALAEGEVRSLDGDVRILQKKNGKVKFQIIQGLDEVTS